MTVSIGGDNPTISHEAKRKSLMKNSGLIGRSRTSSGEVGGPSFTVGTGAGFIGSESSRPGAKVLAVDPYGEAAVTAWIWVNGDDKGVPYILFHGELVGNYSGRVVVMPGHKVESMA